MTSPNTIRIVAADDSAVFRTLIRQILTAWPDVELVATAANGREAVEMVELKKPDLLLLDVQMPVMTGPETLLELSRRKLDLPVIVISASDLSMGDQTVQLLREGALDYIFKPRAEAGKSAPEQLRNLLDRSLKTFRASRRTTPSARTTGELTAGPRLRPLQPVQPTGASPRAPVQTVVIAVSTGGPAALSQVIPKLPANFPVPVLIVQHMPAHFTEHLARSLDKECPLSVAEAKQGEALAPGMVRIAKGDFHLQVQRAGARITCALDQGPMENSCRPAADPLLRSASEIFGPGTLAVVMTGMGSDGLAGVREVRQRGGWCITQSGPTCAVYGMPRAVVEAGQADEVVALEQLGARIQNVVESSRSRRHRA